MKPSLTPFCPLLVFLIALAACEKEEAIPPVAPETAFPFPEKVNSRPNHSAAAWSSGPVPDCAFSPCQDMVDAVREEYQPLADSLCDTLWLDLTCCQGGMTVFALMHVAPKAGCSSTVSAPRKP